MNKLGPYDLDNIITGDAQELAKAIPDESIDIIFTDPPYSKEYLYLYEWLFSMAARALKPNGFLLVYAGNYWKDEVMMMARAKLDYFWDYQTVMNTGNNSVIWPRKTIAISKSILAYRPRGGQGMPRTNVLGAWFGGSADKRYHIWGQDESTARYYIDCFSKDGDVIFDPFVGGGTTAYVCRVLGRPYLAFEFNASIASIARARVEHIQPLLFVSSYEQGAMNLDMESA